MHQPQAPPDFAFLGQNLHEDFARSFGILVCARDLPKRATDQVLQFWAKIDIVSLCEFKGFHHLDRIHLEKIATICVQVAVPNEERSQLCFSPAPQR